jgi:hypothetical protein
MRLAVALQLGRVSNLPTVWSNVLAGTVLAGGKAGSGATLLVMLALSLFYVGGMYLNDAFDRDIDSQERPTRPIPAGLISANTVFAAGFGLLLTGIAVMVWVAAIYPTNSAWRPILASVALAAAILFYDWDHKANPLSPLFMGLCRVLVYVIAGYAAVSEPSPWVFGAALVSLSYLIGLTFIAKQEAYDRVGRLWPLIFLGAPFVYTLPQLGHAPMVGGSIAVGLAASVLVALALLRRRARGDVGRAVVGLIAAISLVDALFLALAGAPGAASVAVLCYLATLVMQRWVSGT